MITTYRGAEARVIYGYYDGSFHVQYTDLIHFNEHQFYDQILSLLQWALPVADDKTTACCSLPTIVEEDESEKKMVKQDEEFWEDETLWSDPSSDSDASSVITL